MLSIQCGLLGTFVSNVYCSFDRLPIKHAWPVSQQDSRTYTACFSPTVAFSKLLSLLKSTANAVITKPACEILSGN